MVDSFAVGCIAVGTIAVGSIAVGSIAVGSIGVGSIAVGTCAVFIAVGTITVGTIAVGSPDFRVVSNFPIFLKISYIHNLDELPVSQSQGCAVAICGTFVQFGGSTKRESEKKIQLFFY